MIDQRAERVLVRAERLTRHYQDGQVRALDGVDLAVAQGEFTAVVGPSGSGKSTLLNLLGALDRPTDGEVYFEGRPLSGLRSLDRFRAHKLGFVFQSFHLVPVLNSLRNVQVPMFETTRRPSQRVERARELLALVGMSHRAGHKPAQLSMGERQRVAIARALANEPVLLLADEPTGNLDTKTAREIFDLFERLNEQGMTLIVVTHDPALASRARRVLHMRDGKIVEDCT